jgi:hypothetical protein
MIDHTLSVPHQRPHYWRLHEGPAHLNQHDAAHVSMAIAGIQTITAVLLQREIDTECTGDACLRLGSVTTTGLLDALSCCTELMDIKLTAATHRTEGAA